MSTVGRYEIDPFIDEGGHLVLRVFNFVAKPPFAIVHYSNVWWAWLNVLIIQTRIEHCWSHALISLSNRLGTVYDILTHNYTQWP